VPRWCSARIRRAETSTSGSTVMCRYRRFRRGRLPTRRWSAPRASSVAFTMRSPTLRQHPRHRGRMSVPTRAEGRSSATPTSVPRTSSSARGRRSRSSTSTSPHLDGGSGTSRWRRACGSRCGRALMTTRSMRPPTPAASPAWRPATDWSRRTTRSSSTRSSKLSGWGTPSCADMSRPASRGSSRCGTSAAGRNGLTGSPRGWKVSEACGSRR
jgi:hypothetical protein